MESIVDLPQTTEDLLTIAQFNDTVRLGALKNLFPCPHEKGERLSSIKGFFRVSFW